MTCVKPFVELKPTVYYYIRPEWDLTHLPTICSMSQLPWANPEELTFIGWVTARWLKSKARLRSADDDICTHSRWFFTHPRLILLGHALSRSPVSCARLSTESVQPCQDHFLSTLTCKSLSRICTLHARLLSRSPLSCKRLSAESIEPWHRPFSLHFHVQDSPQNLYPACQTTVPSPLLCARLNSSSPPLDICYGCASDILWHGWLFLVPQWT